MAGEEEGETLHGAPQRDEDVQDLHEVAAANTQVNTLFSVFPLLALRVQPTTFSQVVLCFLTVTQ